MKNFILVLLTAIIMGLLTFYFTRNYYTKQIKEQAEMLQRMSEPSKIPYTSLATFMRDSISSPQFNMAGGQVLKSSLQAILDSSEGKMLSIMIGSTDVSGINTACLVVQSANNYVNVLMMHDTTECCIVVAPCCPPPKNVYIHRNWELNVDSTDLLKRD
jgi:hypothetical protein